MQECRKELSEQDLAENADAVLAACLARMRESRPDLAAVVETWDGLSQAVKAGIVAMVEASRT